MSKPEASQQSDNGVPRPQNIESANGSSENKTEETGPEVDDPLAFMAPIDKWGLKGFSYMMNNYPDYASLVTGIDLTTLGFDLTSPE